MTREVVTSHSPFVIFGPLDLELELIVEVVDESVEEIQHVSARSDLGEARFQGARERWAINDRRREVIDEFFLQFQNGIILVWFEVLKL